MFEKFKQGIGPVFLLPEFSYARHIRMVRFEMVMTLLVMTTCAALQSFDITSARAQVPAVPEPIKTTEAARNHSSTQNIVEPEAHPVIQPPAVPHETAAPSCRQTSGASAMAVSLGNYGDGLTILRDSPRYYQVYGNDPSAIRNQIALCGPTNEYAGDSSYNLNWSYALRADETGLCRVVGVKVGLHTSIVVPYREATGNETAGLIDKWSSFHAALMAHENGHVAIAEQYASRMLYSLQAYPAGDCYTMSPYVEAAANGIASQLRTAQVQYDLLTRHGGTQGAIF